MDKLELENDFEHLIDDRIHVLNHCDTFAIINRWGDITPNGNQVQGLYHRDTRFVHCLQWSINGKPFDLLSSTLTEENETLSIDLCNPPLLLQDELKLPGGTIHVHRNQLVKNGVFHEQLHIKNFWDHPTTCILTLDLRSDFADIFEVRGAKRRQRGTKQTITTNKQNHITIPYLGLDQVLRRAIIHFATPFTDFLDNHLVQFNLYLESKQTLSIEYAIHFEEDNRVSQPIESYKQAHDFLTPGLRNKNAYFPIVETSNEQFNHWISRSQADLVSLMADTPFGKYPYAGVPWYNTAFGRDGLITAWQTLWLAPELSRNVLLFLASRQATTSDPTNDAEPGKILHETRNGEMVALNEVPFKNYYGTIDATPLFIMLAGAYYERSADDETLQQLWPNIRLALEWIDTYGDQDGDGFVEYHHQATNGLTNQGWKDSYDAISHANGDLAKSPIALCEIQGYIYAAKKYGSKLASVLGDKALAYQLSEQALSLKKAFNAHFWDDDLNCYILALDGNKNPCRVKSSNAGQVLFTGIAYPHLASRMVKTLFKPDFFCGWGIRTLSTEEKRYNPMSYHNGSVWPHDVSLIAEGFARYGFTKEAACLTTGLFDASLFIPLQRLPELFCGFERRHGEGPTAYPVACSPQAWSVSAVFLLLKSILRITIKPAQRSIYFEHPYLPPYLNSITIKNLWLSNRQKADLEIIRHDKSHASIRWYNQPKDWKLVLQK